MEPDNKEMLLGQTLPNHFLATGVLHPNNHPGGEEGGGPVYQSRPTVKFGRVGKGSN